MNKIQKYQNGFIHFYVLAVLATVVVGVGYVAINVSNEAKNQLKEDSGVSASKAADSYFSKNPVPATNAATQASTSSSKPVTTSTKIIAGNSNPAVKPVLSPQVAIPKTSIDSIRTFFNAVKAGDFATANALMGPRLATSLAKISNTQEPAKALQACNANSTCKLVLYSFEPPKDGSYKTKSYTGLSGKPGEQISFPLSKANPLVASQIGDYNIDIFSEKYAGDIWVLQDLYINGKSAQSFFTK